MIEYRKNDGGFIFFNNNKELLTKNKNQIIVKNKIHAKKISQEFHNKKKIKDQYSNLNLTLFSCNLNESDKKLIISSLLNNIEFDIIFYRGFNDSQLNKLLNKKLNYYFNNFKKKFDMKLRKLTSINEKNEDLSKDKFEYYLNALDNFKLTTIYKLSGISKSVILSYFFLEKRITFVDLFELTNIENFIQQKKWGYVPEQREKDKEMLKILKNISIFFKNVI
tara:strand:- start:461 stop:1126 length:666 start_codon:yes stop_codon:yes gene_type:complete